MAPLGRSGHVAAPELRRPLVNNYSLHSSCGDHYVRQRAGDKPESSRIGHGAGFGIGGAAGLQWMSRAAGTRGEVEGGRRTSSGVVGGQNRSGDSRGRSGAAGEISPGSSWVCARNNFAFAAAGRVLQICRQHCRFLGLPKNVSLGCPKKSSESFTRAPVGALFFGPKPLKGCYALS